MTQSQLRLYSATSIITWAGSINNSHTVLRYLGGDNNLPFIERGGLYHYFVKRPDCYELVMTSTLDLNGE